MFYIYSEFAPLIFILNVKQGIYKRKKKLLYVLHDHEAHDSKFELLHNKLKICKQDRIVFET